MYNRRRVTARSRALRRLRRHKFDAEDASVVAFNGGVCSVCLEPFDEDADVRLGQLLAHLGFLGEDQTGRSLWEIDDEQLLAILHHHRDELAARKNDSPDESPRSTVAFALPPAPAATASRPATT